MKRAFFALLIAAALPAAAEAFTVSGRFLYEDRLYDGNGYTGEVQNLPIRRAKVEVVDAITQETLATGATGADGRYALAVAGGMLPVSFYVRCSTDGREATPRYEIRVVDNFVRDIVNGQLVLTGSMIYAITTDPTLAHTPTNDFDYGDYLIQDTDGTGVAQAFNILDNAVDVFDWLAQPGILGRLPSEEEFVVYGWKWSGTPGNPPPAFGSNYSLQGIFIGASPNEDTDGWSDTVILHETGHWLDDVYLATDNVGGEHFIGDNDANVLLAYGEGAATYHCAKVREWRAGVHTNLEGEPVDERVSLYADLLLPPAVGTPGGLSFGYDFETGNFSDTNVPIGQIGSANETNVTSALWDLMDGPSTPDFTPGIDDEVVDVGHEVAWDIERNYLHPLPAAEYVTVEDYYQGWFSRNGDGYLQSGVEQVFVTLAKMPFVTDSHEPDNATAGARTIVPQPYTVATGRVVISELEFGSADAIELYNGTPADVDLTGWQIQVYANTDTLTTPPQIYTFPPFTLAAGEVVALHEGDPPLNNGRYHVYGGDRQVFNASWNAGLDGAVTLRNAQGTPVDFVKWRGVDGNGQPYDNDTPVPAGLAFNGALDTPAPPQTLARDASGTDTDSASDWSAHFGSLGSVNHPAPELHTVYSGGDHDVVAFAAEAGKRYGFEALGPYSATDPFLELLDANGDVIGTNDDGDTPVRHARLDFYASSSGTYLVRVGHVGEYTDWGEYQLLAYVRPIAAVFAPPSGMVANAENASDASDPVELQWVNAGAYDAVRVYRDGTLLEELAGAPGAYVDHAPRGLHRYEIAGVLNGTETGRAMDYAFAGIVTCFGADDFEQGNAANWIRDGSTWDVTPMAQEGVYGFTDSPTGTYQGCPEEIRPCPNNAIATFGVPSQLRPGATLRWQQIVITEHCEPTPCDVAIVEVSTDEGSTWTEIARYDQASDPAWADNVADPTDWRPASADLGPFAGQRALVRFRLQSDQLLDLDGWYVDDVQVSDESCLLVAVADAPTGSLLLLPPTPNPVRSDARFAWVLPSREERVNLGIYDVSGRLIREARLGAMAAGAHNWIWDGRDGGGRRVASGAYFVRLLAGKQVRTHKLLKLEP